MHPTRNSAALIFSNLAGGRVMPGVGQLRLCESDPDLDEGSEMPKVRG
jgi:hypothetical protein